MSLVNRNSGVDHMRLNNLLLNDRLNVLMDVVMDSLAADNRGGFLRSGSVMSDRGISVPRCILLKRGPDIPLIAVVELLVLHSSHVVVVLLRKSLPVCDGLHSGVVMMLVNLLVYGSLNMLMLVRLDMLLCDGGSDLLIDGRLVLAIVREERGNGGLCFLHCV